MERIGIGMICLVALYLNIYGIWGGVPNEERIKLIFPNKKDIKEMSKVMEETWRELYQRSESESCYIIDSANYKEVVYKGEEIKMPKWLINSMRSFLLRSSYFDEQAVLVSLGRMNPQKLDFNPDFFTYGELYTYLVGASLMIASVLNLLTLSQNISYYFLHPEQMAKMYIVGRLVGALMGVFAVYIIYLLASLLYNKKTGLIAALFLSSMPAVVVFSHYLKPYVFNLPFLLLSFYMAVKILSSEKKSNYIWSGFFAGLAGGILLPFGLIFASILIAHLIKRFSQAPRISTFLSLFERNIIFAIVALITAFIIANPHLLVSLKEAFNEYRGLSAAFPFRPTFEGCLYYLKVGLTTALGLPLFIVVGIGILYSFYKREKTDFLLLFFIFLAYFFITSTTSRYVHYGIWLLPFLVLLGARVIGVLLEKGKITKCIAMVIFLFVFVYNFLYSLSYDKMYVEEDIRITCGKWMIANIEPGASIGYNAAPLPQTAPLINPFKYKIKSWQEEKDWKRELPLYFVCIKEWDIWIDWGELEKILKGRYQEIKRFEKTPEIFGIRFKKPKEPPCGWVEPNPTLIIYKRVK